jgi:hypothetical protein
MPIDKSGGSDRYGSGSTGWGNREDYSRASLLPSSQHQQVVSDHLEGWPSDQIASYRGLDPRAVQDFLREQGFAVDQPEAGSSRGQTSSFEEHWEPYIDPDASHYEFPEPPTPQRSSSRQPSQPPASSQYYSSSPHPGTAEARRSSTLPAPPPSSYARSSSRMPTPSAAQQQSYPYPPVSSRFEDSPPPEFTEKGLPTGWAVDKKGKFLRSPGDTVYTMGGSGKGVPTETLSAYSRLRDDTKAARDLSLKDVSKALGKGETFLSGKRLPTESRMSKKEAAQKSRVKYVKNNDPEARSEIARKAAATRFFGKDDGLTTEAPVNPGSFFPQRAPSVIDLTGDDSGHPASSSSTAGPSRSRRAPGPSRSRRAVPVFFPAEHLPETPREVLNRHDRGWSKLQIAAELRVSVEFVNKIITDNR